MDTFTYRNYYNLNIIQIMTNFKSIIIMAAAAVLVWGVPVLYAYTHPERFLLPDAQRWEVWWAIIGGIAAMFTPLYLRWFNAREKH